MTAPCDIVALDLATSTGWARWKSGAKVRHGTIKMPKTGPDVGRFLSEFDYRLADLLTVAPDIIVFEAPWIGPNTHQATARKLMSLAGHVEFICFRSDIPVREVNNATVRKHFCGKGKASRNELKSLVMQACRARGWEPANDDEADALAVLDFAAHVYKLDAPWPCGALFGEAA